MAHYMRFVEERGIAHFLQRRDSSASAPSLSILSSMPSSVIYEGPESLPPTTTPVATSNTFPASSLALATALSILGLIILGMLLLASTLYYWSFTSIRHRVLAFASVEKKIHPGRC